MTASPCVKICTLDARCGLCLGCEGTIDKIARWSGVSAVERARVTGELVARLAGGQLAPTAAKE
jgi:predicted Fe-S protein YdhL (DUF1289 family)